MDPDHPAIEQSGRTTHNSATAHAASLLMTLAMTYQARALRPGVSAPLRKAGSLTRNLVGGVVGNILEWYDFAVFGFFAPVIGEHFFPAEDPMDSLLGAFGVFAAAYLARPLGGTFFGYVGDRFGRKKALQLSVMMMAVPTCLIGILPTHSQIGLLAPLFLVVLRMAQGLSVGGELIGSIAFVAETAPPARRGYFASWTFASCYAGMTLGSLTAVWLNRALGHTAVSAWGWRLPFLAGILIGVAGLWMRTGLTETPAFERMKAADKIEVNPLSEAMRRVPWRILHAALLVILVGGGFYILFIWWPTLLGRYVYPHVPQAMELNTVSMLLLVILIPVTGHLSDRLGRRPLLVASAAGLTLASWPLFMLVSSGSLSSVIFAQLCFTALMSTFLGPIPATLVDMFPARMRYSAIAISYNISLCVFGGTAPLLATWLVKQYQTVSAPGLYLTFLAGLNLLAVVGLPHKLPSPDHAMPRPRSIARSRDTGTIALENP